MIVTAMLDGFMNEITKKIGDENLMLDTVGDRILHLLRYQGRAERRREYTQSELLAMLNGEMDAPNGKRYDIKTNKSSLSRIISGDQKPPLDLLDAICDIFEVDLEWLGRGKELDPSTSIEQFITDEANRIGGLVDKMPLELRLIVDDYVKTIYNLLQSSRANEVIAEEREQQIRQYQSEVARLHKQIELLRQQIPIKKPLSQIADSDGTR